MPQPPTSHQIQNYCHPYLQEISLVDSQKGFLLHKEFQVYENLEELRIQEFAENTGFICQQH